MTNDIAITDDMKAFERWENEGGKVSPFNNVWASLKRFRTQNNSRERQVMDTRKSVEQQHGVFSGFNLRRVVQ